MVKIIIVDRNGELEEISYEDTISNIHKITGYKTKRNFFDRGSWPWKGHYITLFAKDTGRANQENKYDLPPPLDNDLFFNKMVLVKHSEMTIAEEDLLDLTLADWKSCYEKLFGGFEDLGEDDSYSSEEEIPLELQTKHGYSKEGGFVVDSEEEEEEGWVPEEEAVLVDSDDDDDEDDEEEFEDDEADGSELSEDSYYSD
tara:strand:- start:1478 stop:2077 length:600 start_codon:yes stop_codon:yes gene_type:complete